MALQCVCVHNIALDEYELYKVCQLIRLTMSTSFFSNVDADRFIKYDAKLRINLWFETIHRIVALMSKLFACCCVLGALSSLLPEIIILPIYRIRFSTQNLV